MQQIKRDNHFVSQRYLKNWGDNKSRVWSYQLLVPRSNYQKWRLLPIGGIAFQRDFYTIVTNGQENDDFERWIEKEFETPAADALIKIKGDKKLSPNDLRKLALYLAVQDVRTPLNYFETMKRWEEELPKLLENTLEKTAKLLDEHYKSGKPIPVNPTRPTFFGNNIKVSISPVLPKDANLAEIRAEVIAGRKLWIESLKYVLTNTAKVLLNHKWGIITPAKGMSWFTSDHPVVRLNYYKEGEYDLRGGWGQKKGNIFLPLSPKHLLFTQIGEDIPDYFEFTVEKTYEIQKFLAERAFRYIFAHKKMLGIEKLRPRHVNLSDFRNEEEQWKNWHQEQSASEIKS